MPKPHLWMDKYPIADRDHAHGLEQDAAVEEFHNHLPRAEAEARAHQKYLRDQHARAAAHHLRGSRAAQGAGSVEDARKHGLLYASHVRAMALNPIGAVPKEVLAHIKPDTEPMYTFRAHPSDEWLLQG